MFYTSFWKLGASVFTSKKKFHTIIVGINHKKFHQDMSISSKVINPFVFHLPSDKAKIGHLWYKAYQRWLNFGFEICLWKKIWSLPFQPLLDFPGWALFFFMTAAKIPTGKSFSEALILASVNPQYEKRLFIEFPEKIQVHNMLCTKNVFCFCFDI